MARGALFGRLLGARVKVPMAAPDTTRLSALAARADAGDLRVPVDRTFTFAEADRAIRHLEVEHARGKVVVTG